MKFEHYYSSQQKCWLVCRKSDGELMQHQPTIDGTPKWVCIEYQSEEDVLYYFLNSVNITEIMGD